MEGFEGGAEEPCAHVCVCVLRSMCICTNDVRDTQLSFKEVPNAMQCLNVYVGVYAFARSEECLQISFTSSPVVGRIEQARLRGATARRTSPLLACQPLVTLAFVWRVVSTHPT